MSDVNRDEFNGLGSRVNCVEKTLAVHGERIETLKEEFLEHRDETWKAIDKLRDEVKSAVVDVAKIIGTVSVIIMIIMTVVSKVF